MSKAEKYIAFATGGTGGHIFPAQALGEALLSKGYTIAVFTDGRGVSHLNSSFLQVPIPADHFRGSWIKKTMSFLKLIISCGIAFNQLRRLKPVAVIGFGGYASFPTLVAATLLKIPLIIHQADAYLGRTNRKFLPFVARLAISFPEVKNILPLYSSKVCYTGLPLRPEILHFPYKPSQDHSPFHLLITGGSQGARIFSEILPAAIAKLDPILQKRLIITQQCRLEYLEKTRKLYENTQAQVTLEPFFQNIGEHYKNAHLILSRAGASSVLEAATVGRPTLFIPYPYAMDNHQEHNAYQAVRTNGAWLLREKDLSINELADFLAKHMTSPWQLEQAAVNIHTLAQLDASEKLAALVEHVIENER